MKPLCIGSLFSGIGGFDLGFERAGFKTKWQVEIDSDCRQVLRRHFPSTAIHQDIEELSGSELDRVDVICAGVPCQDVSVAGQRAGLAGRRTGLFYDFARILKAVRPTWFVFENVPGLFSSNGGRDFAEVLRVLMVECRYGVSWRVLNSQFFGVAQRRRRVFIVGYFGKPCPAEILFESDSGKRNSSTRFEAGAGIARAVGGSSVSSGYRFDPNGEELIAATLSSRGHPGSNAPGRRREDDENLIVNALSPVRGGPDDNDAQAGHIVIQDVRGGTRDKTDAGQGIGIREGGPCYTLSKTEQHAVAFAENQRGELRTSEFMPQLSCAGGKPGSGYPADSRQVMHGMSVRRLTPRECERLQGFPDDFTIPVGRTEDGLDSARYRALGNAVTVSVAEWIARRIAAWEVSHA